MDFQHRIIPRECTCKPVLTDSEFRERATGQWFEELVGVTPFRFDYFIEFRTDPILYMRIE